jgi:transcriptional regulator with XRE-family HTH domain
VSKRTSKVMLTNECRVLKQLREEAGLSMRAAGLRHLNVSSSMISQIENGRERFPDTARLQPILDAYGGLKVKSFWERVRVYKHQSSAIEELHDLVERLQGHQAAVALAVVKAVLECERFKN